MSDFTLNDMVRLGEATYRSSAMVSKTYRELAKSLEAIEATAPVAIKVRDIIVASGICQLSARRYSWSSKPVPHFGGVGTSPYVGVALFKLDPEVIITRVLGPIHRALGVYWTMQVGSYDKSLSWSAYIPVGDHKLRIGITCDEPSECNWEEEVKFVESYTTRTNKFVCA